MSDLTNTPKREPAYGKSAARFNAERIIGIRALALIQRGEVCIEDNLRTHAIALGLIQNARPAQAECDCGASCRERGNGRPNMCEDCAYEAWECAAQAAEEARS